MLVLLLSAVVAVSVGTPLSLQDSTPQAFTVNLDLAPAQRWGHVVTKFSKLAKDAHKVIESLVPEDAIPLVEEIGRELDSYLPMEYADEMRGIATAMNTSLGDIVLVNLAYDITAFCTSIVCQDSKGQIWHARNLDYSYGDILRSITIKVDFQKGGQTVYTGVTFAGYVGLLTGQRPQAFTVTVDERDQGQWWMNLLIAILDQTAKPLSLLVRDVLATSTTYADAVDTLSSTDTEADAYFIVGGAKSGEGVVITKSRIGADDLWYMNEAAPGWFIVETNYDHWVPPPTDDNRRDPAVNAMKAMGQGNISVTSLYNVISTHPVLNNKTVYSIVMSAAQPTTLTSWIRIP
ncbi:N-acylethanolamine-hydrolyzing acid amidase-like [Haliotis cracherodii]|uniref:N-acylethanolamine-hydrolyzing acid amidase-like n=1 Tax=Haliotis cracherodii TaxID=6455 RepID=UPI0039EAD87C